MFYNFPPHFIFRTMSRLVALLALAAVASAASVPGGCEMDINGNLPKKNDPVYLLKGKGGRLEFALPEEGSLHLKKNAELLLACTGGKNTLVASGDELTSTKCSSGSKLNLGSKPQDAGELVCSKRSSASLKITNEICAEDGAVIIQSGFEVDGQWLPLVDTCHNIEESKSYWSKHTLYGSRLGKKVIQSNRPGFSRGDRALFKGFDPDGAYQQSNQEVIFEKIYGKKSAASYIRSAETLYLARGHLAPDADFLYSSWQMLTYFYVNAAPQWQSINAGYWLAVENNARKLAINTEMDLLSVTGTYGILELADDRKKMQPAYLEGDRLPVPELYWKLLANEADNSCIVLISTNNPYLTKPPKTICPDICSKSGWPSLKAELTKGYVYCCDYKSFKNAVTEVPNVKCNSILNFK